MAITKNQQSTPTSQWKPQVIELRLRLAKQAMNESSPFFSLISRKNGFHFPKFSNFKADIRNNPALVRVDMKNSDDAINHLTFRSTTPTEKLSDVCTRLNIAASVESEINAILDGKDVIFSITVPNETAEVKLLRHFSFLDEANH